MTSLPDKDSLLIIRLGALGDVANTLPAVAALRKALPTVSIVWLVEEGARDLVAAAGVVDEIMVFPRKMLAKLWSRPWHWAQAVSATMRFIHDLRQYDFACALDFQGNFKSALLGVASGTPDRIGFARGFSREMSWVFNNILAVPVSRRLPRAEKNAALAQTLAPDLKLEAVEFPRNVTAAAPVEAFLRELPKNGPLVVIHPGASAFGDFKRWPAERYGQLALRLSEQVGANCVITHGPGEQPLAEAAAAASEGAASLAPALNIPELIELLRRSDLVIGGDTGPLHIAAILNRPVAGIYGPKDSEIYGPYTARREIVRVGLECSPCARRKCDQPDCMRKIEVQDVLAAALRLLQKPS